MKTVSFYLVKISYILLISSVFFACNQSKKENKKLTEKEIIPTLLAKNAAIGTEEERQLTIERYQSFVQALQQNPEDMEARLYLSHLYMNEARLTGEHGYYYPAALGMLESVLMRKSLKDDTKFKALLLKSIVLMSLHQFDKAQKIAQEAVSINPHNAQIYGVLVDANVELGNYEEAVKMSDKMLSIRPDLRSYSRASYLREIHGDIEGAVEAMDMAIKAGYPGLEERAWCRITLGNIYENDGDLEKAKFQYDMALAERENYPFAIAGNASIAMKKGNYLEAENLLKQACSIIPEVGFYVQLVDLYQKNNRNIEAEKTLNDIWAMLADDEANGHQMSLEYADLHFHITQNYDQALLYALNEYKVRPQNIDVNRQLAAIYLAKNDVENAEKHAELAMRTGSKNTEIQCVVGLIKTKNGEMSEGLSAIKKSLAKNPYQDHFFVQEAKDLIKDEISMN